jgi:hypothetical protein
MGKLTSQLHFPISDKLLVRKYDANHTALFSVLQI